MVIPRQRIAAAIERVDVPVSLPDPPPPSGAAEAALARLAWVVPSLVALVLSLVRLTWPGLWADELATWGMASTPWGRMWSVLGNVDASLAPYYAFTHVLSDLFGPSDLVLRLPSALAMTAAVGIVAAIGSRLAGPRLGLVAGLLFAVLPTTSRYAQEARPYAIAVFAVALSTLLLLRVLDAPTRGRYAWYAAAVALVGLAHFVALLILVAHAVIVVAFRGRLGRDWFGWAGLGVLPAIPLVWLAFGQRAQVSWIPDANLEGLGSMVSGLVGVPVLGGILLVLMLLGVSMRRPTAVFTAWCVIPTVLLFGVSQVDSLWLPRYLLFTLPAWALLAATTLNRSPLIRGVLVVTAVAVVGLPAQIDARNTSGHGQASSALAATLAANEQPGDGIVYAQNDPGGGWVGRDIVAHYVPAGSQPRDVLLTRAQRSGGHLLAGECADVSACVDGTTRLWVIRNGRTADPIAGLGFDRERILRDEYAVNRVWNFAGLTLALLVSRSDTDSVVGH
jgi:mannosyltransferase